MYRVKAPKGASGYWVPILANPDIVEKYKAGNKKVVGAIVGQVMKATRGKADPAQVNQLIAKKLG